MFIKKSSRLIFSKALICNTNPYFNLDNKLCPILGSILILARPLLIFCFSSNNTFSLIMIIVLSPSV